MAERKAFLLRIDPALWEDLNRWASQELRSVNGQIEYLLRRAVDEKFGRRPPEPDAGPEPKGRRSR
ncbi:MAG TPA: hypothetical protein VF139_02140 [Candidatus Polarisedimenticolaceae bacterium]